jgi:hypothetical protein
MSSIEFNNEAAGQFSNMKRRTFGIECEFIGLTPKNISQDATECACQILQRKVTLKCKNKCEQVTHQWYLPVRDTVAQGKATTGSTFSAWEVQTDVSISLDDDEYQTYMSVADRTNVTQVELVSRILNLDGPTPCPRGQVYPCTGEAFAWEWRAELQIIFDALRAGFNRPGYRMLVNKSTGIHVHLGNGSFGFPVDTVKSILGGFVAFERHFDSIMPVSRIIGRIQQPLYGMNLDGFTFVPSDHTLDFSHGYLESVSEAMSSHVDRLIEEQLAESSPTDWDPDYSPSHEPDLAPDEIAKVDDASEGGPFWDVVDTEDWEKVQPLQWPGVTADEPPVEPWGQSPENSWGQAADETWIQPANTTESQQENDGYAWDTLVYPSRVPTDPAKAARTIHKLLLSYNVPTWLKQIKAMETIDDIKRIGTPHKTALNFEHLDIPLAGITKNTIEVRMHAGSLCPVEIISWIDLLGSLTQHIESKGMQSWFTYCNIMYAQPKFTLIDLCRWVGCTRSTISHYKDVISSSDYAERRHKRYITGSFNTEDHLYPLTLNIEDNRLEASTRGAISQRMRQKLESGRYGQFPLSYLQAYIPEASSHAHAVGALDIDSKQQEGYLRKAFEGYCIQYPGHPSVSRTGWWQWMLGMFSRIDTEKWREVDVPGAITLEDG